MKRFLLLYLLFFPALVLAPAPALGTTKPDLVPEKAGIDQNLNQQLDTSLPFTAADGRTAPLKDFLIPGRPAIIVPVYYGCPRLCGYTLNGVVKLINELEFSLGTDFKVLAVSFDPEETAKDAAESAKDHIAQLAHPDRGEKGWEFLTGTPASVNSLMTQLGFKYEPDGKEFAHTAGLMVLTPSGKISRYFFGIEYTARDMRYSLVEASQGRIGGIIDHVFLYCFRFDPTKGKYSLVVWNITRVICILGVFAMAGLLISLRLSERRSNEKRV